MNSGKIARPIVAALSLALLSTAAVASPSHGHQGSGGKQSCAEGKSGHSMSGKQSMRSQGGMQLPAEVLEQLKLTDAQKLSLFNAQTASRAMREGMRESMSKVRENRQQQMQSGDFNPRAMFEQQDKRMASMQEARKAIQNQWLGFWDSLNDEQKKVVREHMQARAKDGGTQGGKHRHHS
jgi:Spy/CpxP family protein refolding chaperone